MEHPLGRNRLDDAASPYLRQHADNPVNWQPWDEPARSAAADLDRPIFLSIGYAACHWCHVMADESFADETVAEALNEGFVPIKVDREERPDVDTIYMTVCQAVTGRGGWPLSVWLTPDGRPFYVGTYFPREPRRGNPGFLDVLRQIRTAWSERRNEIETRADEWAELAGDRLGGSSDSSATTDEPGSASPGAGLDAIDPDARADSKTLDRLATAILRTVDEDHGGFGGGQKFPQPRRIEALLELSTRTDRPAAREAATDALDAMCTGGLYDHVGGGFHRYCVDADWTVPHFEKMLYDNATIPRALLAGYQVTGDERYAETVRETIAFLDRELSHPDGGFYSTLDAQSPGEDGEQEEGAFYVWTPSEIESAVAASSSAAGTSAELFCERYGITESGNFEGRTVLNVETSVAALADEYGLSIPEVESHLEDARRAVFDARSDRPRPARDEKILAGWNGLAIDSVAEAALVLDDETYEHRALEALSFVEEQLWDETASRLNRRYRDGEVGISGYLEDYAFLARGALTCYEATGDVSPLAFAIDLCRTIADEFWDEADRTLYFTPESGESLLTRPQELRDGSTPSPTGVAVDVLLALDPFVDDPFGEIAEAVIATHADTVERSPVEHVSLSLATDRLRRGPLELTVVSESVPPDWRDAVASTYLPDRLLARRPPADDALSAWVDELGVDEVPPIWAGRTQRDGRPTVYACRDRACSPPLHDMGEALEWHDADEDEADPSPF
ncbi:thioredoxin domain-containing protein [Halovivax limisalsi]|uniref:thioredoxin domain-containing protein n=1 Tax=Halovivax limisalsi TaxID=1453760 RepID=UPI001FFD8466|nr:thioredoxin domain-containing protein [Halovivax limisalsi]